MYKNKTKNYAFLTLLFITLLNSTFVYSNNTYIVGYSTSCPPIQYINDDGKADGIAIAILDYLQETSNMHFNYYEIDDNKNAFVNTHHLNISNLHHNTDPLIYTQATIPFYNLNLVLTGHKDHKNDEAVEVGILDYINLDVSEIYELLPNAKIHYFDFYDDLTEALHNNDIDYMFSNTNKAQEFLNADKDGVFQNYPISYTVPMKIYLLGSVASSVVDKLNEGIEDFASHAVSDIVLENAMLPLADMSFLETLTAYDYIGIVTTTIISIVAISGLFLFLLFLYRRHLTRITFYDKVTGFFTEYKFNIETTKVLSKALPNEYTIVAVDIDNFQYVNEVYGFDTGTYILERFGKYLSEYYPSAVHFTRIHSDNFIVLIRSEDLIKDNKNADHNFNEEDFHSVLGDYCHFYTSKGIYNIADPTQTLATIVGCVNLARVSGKSTYGNTAIVFTDSMHKKRAIQNKILSTMEQALKDKEFEVYYQPKITLHNQTTYGGEALIRWIVKDGAPIFPDEFIPLFEKNRYITKLDFYVFEEVCIFISEHREELGDRVISVNLSTITLLQKDLLSNLLSLLLRYNVPINSVELEVTESAFVDNFELIMSQITKLKQAGFSIALDDFGSGISSLNQLKNMELDVLKLDKAFLSDSLNQDKGVLIVENVIMLAKKLNLEIVAEGVELIEDVNLLTKLGCDIAQGYYYSRPVPKGDFLQFIREFDDKKM